MMNYVYDPEVAATIAAYVNYISPVKGVKEILEKKYSKLAENPLIFPPDAPPRSCTRTRRCRRRTSRRCRRPWRR